MKAKRMLALVALMLVTTVSVLAKDIRTAVFKVDQMHCENCERKVTSNIKFEKGLKGVKTDVKTKTVTITYDAEKTNIETIQKGFRKFKYEAEFVKETKEK